MTDRFKPSEFEIREETAAPGGAADLVRVVKVEPKAQPMVQQFSFGKVDAGRQDYSGVKTRFGSLATTDTERLGRTRKDRRFTLNELSRESLAVDDEERRVVEEKVQARLGVLSEQVKAKASQAGYEQGQRKGYEDSFAKFQEEGNDRLARLEFFLATAEQARDEIFRANERFLMEIVFRVTRMVILRELSVDKDYLLRLTRDLLERIGVRENITIRVARDDAKTMGMLKEGLDRALGGLKNLNIEVSDQVKLGGCILETEWNAIDATVETQLQAVFDSLIGKSEDSGQAGDGGAAPR